MLKLTKNRERGEDLGQHAILTFLPSGVHKQVMNLN